MPNFRLFKIAVSPVIGKYDINTGVGGAGGCMAACESAHQDQYAAKGRLMPIYEYKCSQCGSVSELLVGIGRNSDELVCASCGGEGLEKLISAPSPSVINEPTAQGGGSCCGSNPSRKGCVPGSCCGSS